MQLLRCQPERTPSLFAWLRTVAVREAYRLSAVERRDSHVDELGPCEVWAKALGHVRDMDDEIEARRALEALAGLRDTRRRYLALYLAGFTYDEIAELAGGRTWNHVNRHLGRARRDLRRLS
jgi:DNA-directed RNA polymerase specialized sigma24 family protein